MSVSQEQLDASRAEFDTTLTSWLDTLTAPLEDFKAKYALTAKAAMAYGNLLLEAAQNAPQEVGEGYKSSAERVAFNLHFMLQTLMRYRRDKGLQANVFGISR